MFKLSLVYLTSDAYLLILLTSLPSKDCGMRIYAWAISIAAKGRSVDLQLSVTSPCQWRITLSIVTRINADGTIDSSRMSQLADGHSLETQ